MGFNLRQNLKSGNVHLGRSVDPGKDKDKDNGEDKYKDKDREKCPPGQECGSIDLG